MTPRLAQYGRLWRAALAQMHPRVHHVLLWSTPILALTLAALAWGAYDATTAVRWGVSAASAIVLLAWTFCYLPGAFKLNTPANAQLAPGMRARLLELSMAVWAFGIAGLALGNAGATANVALTVTWFLVASLGMGLAAIGSGIGAWVLLLIWPLMGLPTFIPEAVRANMAHPAFLPLLAALLALPGLATMRAIFPQAGDRHWKLQEKRTVWRDKNAFKPRNGNGMLLHWQAYSLRRAGKRRDLGAMLLHGSGPGLPLGVTALGIGGMGLFGLVLVGIMRLGGYPGAAELALAMGWMWSLLPLFLFQLYTNLLANLTEMPAGQPLLRLAPAMPATAPSFNRLLASTVLRSSLAAWGMATATALLCCVVTGAGKDELLLVASLCGLALPVLALPLRDHARRPRWNPVLQWLTTLALAGACLLAAMPVGRLLDLPVFPTAAGLAIALTAFLVSRRYRSMLRAPFAFPAGRLD